MFSRIWTKPSTKSCSEQLEQLQTALQDCDAVVIGAGAGLSTSAGFVYTGERFEQHFSDFAQKYGIRDMYSGGFYPFPTQEEFWAYWSRYTAPPRKKKNGKEGYYPRYISYRCISGRDRNGISCSLANKYYSGTKLETEVKEVISSMVTIPEFVELISQKIDIQTDVNSLRKKQTAIRNEITKYNGNLLQTEKRLTELDIADRHYQNKVDSLNRILDDLYEKIEDAQTRLDEVNQEITMVEKSAMTKKSIFEMLEGFSKYYDVMSPEDKKALLQAMVSFIELYPEKRDDKHLIKTIHFTFPVTYDGESGALFVRTNEQQVETVALLTREKSVKSYAYVNISPSELGMGGNE